MGSELNEMCIIKREGKNHVVSVKKSFYFMICALLETKIVIVRKVCKTNLTGHKWSLLFAATHPYLVSSLSEISF